MLILLRMDVIGKTDMPRISIVVPNYNHAPYLKQRIDSVMNQSFQDFEVILLDDCSIDDSRSVLLSYKDNPHVTHIVFNKENSGSPFAQWNKGIELAKGEWIWIAESDDWADDNFLEEMINAVDNYPHVSLVFAKARYMQGDSQLWNQKVSNNISIFHGTDFICNHLLYDNEIYNVSMTLFRRDLYEKIDHALYQKMLLCGDWWFYSLLAGVGDVLMVDKLLSYYRQHGSNTSSSAEYQGKSITEGLEILEFIERKYGVPAFKFSRHWGRKLVKYSKKYGFSKDLNRAIRKRVWSKHKLMFFYYIIYSVKK